MIDLRDLRCLTALARHRHFARAAEECGMSQPAFSMRIRQLETRLDTSIVKRGNRFQGLTAEGEAILAHARKILAEVRVLEQEVRSARGELAGRLTLGVIPTAVPYAAHLVVRLRELHPGLQVRILSTTSLSIQQGVDDGRYDAGLTYTEGASPDLMTVEPLYEESYVLLCPTKLAPRLSGDVTWREAAELPLWLLEPEMQNRRILDRVFSDLGVAPRFQGEANGFTAPMVAAVQGAAATVVPRVLLDSLGELPGTVVLPLVDPVVEKSVCLVTPLRAPNIPALIALREAARSS
ncbi:transcriptional regulator, LysR family [Poseidonocella pacifica]|uniref:Transcriptional regulator, LysR family n=2 Tax=Poseidonocella pacifica TaxID=871651 RepID=A0A1I0X1R7_9RHOB|nr:LysR family transcriptional regulator [Poseidonocella pacifica]SFA94607.1 transcriptional regulator, LysR family [Poseidonocella pacifica]